MAKSEKWDGIRDTVVHRMYSEDERRATEQEIQAASWMEKETDLPIQAPLDSALQTLQSDDESTFIYATKLGVICLCMSEGFYYCEETPNPQQLL